MLGLQENRKYKYMWRGEQNIRNQMWKYSDGIFEY